MSGYCEYVINVLVIEIVNVLVIVYPLDGDGFGNVTSWGYLNGYNGKILFFITIIKLYIIKAWITIKLHKFTTHAFN